MRRRVVPAPRESGIPRELRVRPATPEAIAGWVDADEQPPAHWPHGDRSWRAIRAFTRWLAARRAWVAENGLDYGATFHPEWGTGGGGNAVTCGNVLTPRTSTGFSLLQNSRPEKTSVLGTTDRRTGVGGQAAMPLTCENPAPVPLPTRRSQ